MALIVLTQNPGELLQQIKTEISMDNVDTWSFDSKGNFTHTYENWRNKAWFQPVLEEGELRFEIVSNNNETILKYTYGIYHGRFAEMLLSCFNCRIIATPQN